jgi:acetylornithine deacetylase/succinyl-diaminopimelate desuccinylase-like protein
VSGDELFRRPVELLQELIRFDTTNPPGNEADCIAFVGSVLESVGCKTDMYEATPGRPNLVSRIAGGSAPPLLLQGHVDVVTTEGQQWTYPPFEARIADGFVWGRGALDMKGGVAMLVSAFARARADGVELPGDVILALLADEEGGGDLGARFLVEQHAELFDGVRYAISEFGGFSTTVSGRRFYPIQVAEKQICWLKATIRGPGGHGAMINRGGTMARLARFLHDLERKPLPHHVTPVVRQMLETMADALPRASATVLRSLLNPRTWRGALRLLGPRAASLEPMLRNTVSATIVRGGSKINVVPSVVEVELDGRTLPGFGPDDLIRELHDAVGGDVELELVRHDPGPAEPDLTLLASLGDIIRELDPDAIPVPLLQIGVTDARFFSRLGMQTYGFLPLNLPADFEFTKLIHNADERVPVAAVEFGAEAVFRALRLPR